LGAVTVSPETFTMVDYRSADIKKITERLVAQVELPGDPPVSIAVDETMPLARVRIASTDPVVIEIDGGAFEDPKRIRKFFPEGATRVIGRLLFQTKDLRTASFGTPPERDELPLELRVAWDVSAMGRVARLGHPPQQQRWLYAFRTRHGFSDGVDRAFEQLWTGDRFTWSDIEKISADAVASADRDTAA
jgi:hypothetical protein